jgi:hypothetical protein
MNACTVAVYYFPNYHADARNARRYGAGWSEWDLLKSAPPRFPSHQQPKTPIWGYEDEADPAVFARKIDAAADHSVDVFLFDWYAYEDGYFLERALDEGYLHAPNNSRVKFALMWANHDWMELFTARPDRAHADQQLHYPGAVSRVAFERITDDVIARYFAHPSYWRLAGRPYFSIYDLDRLIAGLGIGHVRAALDDFRRRTRAAGQGELHLNTMTWTLDDVVNKGIFASTDEAVQALGIDSVTTYAWVHQNVLADSPTTEYAHAAHIAMDGWSGYASSLSAAYHPNVSMGWDSSPRCDRAVWHTNSYPYTSVIVNNTPQQFQAALRRARTFVETSLDPSQRVVTINAWNEWTEGSYLEPDTVHGMAYLEAIRNTFR